MTSTTLRARHLLARISAAHGDRAQLQRIGDDLGLSRELPDPAYGAALWRKIQQAGMIATSVPIRATGRGFHRN